MALIKSISGIRGTIEGVPDKSLTPIDAMKFAAAYGFWLKNHVHKTRIKVVMGRDARLSGEMVQNLVQYTLVGLGVDVVDLGLSTTPTVEVAVTMEQTDEDIILTASHNPKRWNALKLLNNQGEFLSAQEDEEILRIAADNNVVFAEVDALGALSHNDTYIQRHIDAALSLLPLATIGAIRQHHFRVVVDAVNSTGGIAIPQLLERLGAKMLPLYYEPNGHFPHNPEPLEEHLGDICAEVVAKEADFGIVVDPDVDHLAFITEKGEMFGEEYTLVACANYILSKNRGNIVSNLSSSRALRDIAKKHGVQYAASTVGEANVVAKMKEVNAIIGGEDNGGIVFPELHYGRGALVGVALFLSLLADKNITVSTLRKSCPAYYMSKNKVELSAGLNPDKVLTAIKKRYAHEPITTVDGVKIGFPNSWVHLRKSNTEPIIRIYTEAKSQEEADALTQRFLEEMRELTDWLDDLSIWQFVNLAICQFGDYSC